LGCGDFLIYEYGATQAAFGEDYEFLAKRRADYAASSKKHYGRAASAGIELGFNEAGESLAPFWFDCECGAKNAVVFENGRAELAEGKCVECGKTAASEEIASWKRVSPRAIARPIVVARGLSPCVFASGLGAFGFHLVARGVARDLGVALCPFATWLPEVRERGIAQRVSEGAGAADAVPAPSVLDAWINFGLESFGERMRGHLKEKSFCDELVLD
jgi:hypothetical protein